MELRIGERRLAYESHGAGRAVVLLHAFPFDGRMWRATAEALAGTCRVLLPDMRGFGGSELGSPDPSLADMADDVAALLDHLAIARATVGGMSMGGYVALAFAARHRARLDGLILADTRAAADSEQAAAGRAGAIALVEREGVAALVDKQVAGLLSNSPTEAVREQVRALGRQSAAGVVAGVRALRDRPDRRSELAAIDCPTLVIVGGEDKLSPPAEVAAMARAIPRARFVEIPGAGHLSHLEKPAEVAAAITSFLQPEVPEEHP